MEKTVDTYYKLPPLVLPILHSKGFSLTGLTVMCALCDGDTSELRGEVRMFDLCIEVEYAGVCRACNCVTFCKIRYYGDRLMHWSDDGIRTHYAPKKPMWKRFVKWVLNR